MADIVRDSSGAAKKYGFSSSHGTALSSAPKLSDQWFLEFKTTDGKNAEEYSAYAKSVSPITIQTTTQPVDKYGRRIYIPTRVDFPEVTVSLYDKVDGSTMNFVNELYARHFKNSSMNVDAGLAEELKSNVSHGRKIVETDDVFKSFSYVTVYHWFGDQKGKGHSQRIVLVNPLITSITFSNNDYASSELRVIDINLQPENVIFGGIETEAAIPSWMNLGLTRDKQIDSLKTDPTATAQRIITETETDRQEQAGNSPLGTTVGQIDPDVRNAGDDKPTSVTSSEDNFTTIGGERYIPGQPMTANQVAATSASIAMGNEVSGQRLKDYNTGRELLRSENENQLGSGRGDGQLELSQREKDAKIRQQKQNNINKLKQQTVKPPEPEPEPEPEPVVLATSDNARFNEIFEDGIASREELESVYGEGNVKVRLLDGMGEETQRDMLKLELEQQESQETLNPEEYAYSQMNIIRDMDSFVEDIYRFPGENNIVYIRSEKWRNMSWEGLQTWAKTYASMFPSDSVYSVALTYGQDDTIPRGGTSIPTSTYEEIKAR